MPQLVRSIQNRIAGVLSRAGTGWDWILVALAALIGIMAGLVRQYAKALDEE